MARQPENLRHEKTFSSADFSAPATWGEFILQHPALGPVPGKVFLRDVLGMSGMEVSLGSLPPGGAIPFLHAHKQNEELYLVLSGTGEMQVDGSVIPLQAGSAVRVAPEGVRSWRATGSEPMAYMVIQAQAGSLQQATTDDGVVLDRPVVW